MLVLLLYFFIVFIIHSYTTSRVNILNFYVDKSMLHNNPSDFIENFKQNEDFIENRKKKKIDELFTRYMRKKF